MTFLRNRPTRRAVIKGSGAAGAAALLGAQGGIASASRRSRSPLALAQGSLSGEITVTYADELGVKPKYVEQAAEAVQEANPDATVSIDLRQISGGDFYTQILLALDAGDAPDVLHTGGDKIGELAEAGYLAPLDDYVAEWEDWAQYPDSIKSAVTYNGSVWAIPYGLDTRFLYYRKDLLEEAGLSRDWEPENLAGLLEAANAVKAQLPEQILSYGLYAGEAAGGGTLSHGFVPILLAYGGSLTIEDGKWIASSPEILSALEYYQQAWREDEVVPQDILTSAEPWKPMRSKMGTGELALLFEGGWVYGGYVSAAEEGDVNLDDIGYLLHPTEDAGPSFTIGGPGTVWYMTEASENKDIAWEFIKSFNTAEIVGQINAEDPHPVARTDAAEVAEFASNQFLVDSTTSLESAIFLPASPNLGDVQLVVQDVTGLVAAGEATPEEALERYREGIIQAVGEENTVVQ